MAKKKKVELPKINKHMDALRMELGKEVARVLCELRPVSAIIVNDYSLKDVVKNLIGDLGGIDKYVEKAKVLVNYNQKESFQVASDY